MKKFKFRLAPLLRVRAYIEKQRQKEHAAAVKEVLKQKNQLARLGSQREVIADAQRAAASGTFTSADLLVCSRYLLKLRKDTLIGSELLHGLEREAEKKRKKLVEASRERQVYEKLEERQRERYLKEAARVEQKETDEIAVNTHRVNRDSKVNSVK
jgi:flagellar FliJ protein